MTMTTVPGTELFEFHLFCRYWQESVTYVRGMSVEFKMDDWYVPGSVGGVRMAVAVGMGVSDGTGVSEGMLICAYAVWNAAV